MIVNEARDMPYLMRSEVVTKKADQALRKQHHTGASQLLQNHAAWLRNKIPKNRLCCLMPGRLNTTYVGYLDQLQELLYLQVELARILEIRE